VHVLSAVVEGSAPSTKSAAAALAALQTGRNVLVVVTREDSAGWKSLRNLPEVHLLAFDQLNTYDVLVSDDVVFTRAALDEFLSSVGAEAAAEADASKKTPAKKAAPKKAAAKADPEDSAAEATSDDSNEEEAK
jgi:large subunit ribosomal protein L4